MLYSRSVSPWTRHLSSSGGRSVTSPLSSPAGRRTLRVLNPPRDGTPTPYIRVTCRTAECGKVGGGGGEGLRRDLMERREWGPEEDPGGEGSVGEGRIGAHEVSSVPMDLLCTPSLSATEGFSIYRADPLLRVQITGFKYSFLGIVKGMTASLAGSGSSGGGEGWEVRRGDKAYLLSEG